MAEDRAVLDGLGAKLYPGGARAWDWRETGTRHRPGIQPADIAMFCQVPRSPCLLECRWGLIRIDGHRTVKDVQRWQERPLGRSAKEEGIRLPGTGATLSIQQHVVGSLLERFIRDRSLNKVIRRRDGVRAMSSRFAETLFHNDFGVRRRLFRRGRALHPDGGTCTRAARGGGVVRLHARHRATLDGRGARTCGALARQLGRLPRAQVPGCRLSPVNGLAHAPRARCVAGRAGSCGQAGARGSLRPGRPTQPAQSQVVVVGN